MGFHLPGQHTTGCPPSVRAVGHSPKGELERRDDLARLSFLSPAKPAIRPTKILRTPCVPFGGVLWPQVRFTILFANFEFYQALFLRDHDSSGIPGRLAARNVGLEKPPKKKDENAEHGDLINISWNWRFRSRSPYLRWNAHCLDGSAEPISRTQKIPAPDGDFVLRSPRERRYRANR